VASETVKREVWLTLLRWVGVTAVVYGSRPLDLFVFVVGADGRVRAVVNEALRVRLEKAD
jgi:hypothetical protein